MTRSLLVRPTLANIDAAGHANDGAHYESKVKAWAIDNAPTDAAYKFDA